MLISGYWIILIQSFIQDFYHLQLIKDVWLIDVHVLLKFRGLNN